MVGHFYIDIRAIMEDYCESRFIQWKKYGWIGHLEDGSWNNVIVHRYLKECVGCKSGANSF